MTGAGLAAFGFWVFIAAVVVAGIWYDAKEKETKQETLRRIVESGQNIDAEVIARIIGENESETLDRDLRIAAYIVLSAAPGLALLGLAVGAPAPLFGVAALAGSVGAGLYMAARLAEKDKTDSTA